MSEILLDTSVVVDFLRGRRPEAAQFLNSLSTRPCVSAITLTEVFSGLRRQKDEPTARSFFADCRVLAVTSAIGEGAGVILSRYGASHAVDVPDALIAATVEHHGLVLATLNVKHFPMFARLKPAY